MTETQHPSLPTSSRLGTDLLTFSSGNALSLANPFFWWRGVLRFRGAWLDLWPAGCSSRLLELRHLRVDVAGFVWSIATWVAAPRQPSSPYRAELLRSAAAMRIKRPTHFISTPASPIARRLDASRGAGNSFFAPLVDALGFTLRILLGPSELVGEPNVDLAEGVACSRYRARRRRLHTCPQDVLWSYSC